MLPLPAHSLAEAHLYLKVTPCGECSKGPWEVAGEPAGDGDRRTLAARCHHCGAAQEFTFQCDRARAAPGLEDLPVEPINPTDQPSRIIDLGQWISLFYHLLESADRTPDKIEARRLGFEAAQCLDEALKFYGDDELPARSCFFADASRQAFAEHPEKFARQRLRDMRVRLPDLRAMARRVAEDGRGHPARRRWWRFWKA